MPIATITSRYSAQQAVLKAQAQSVYLEATNQSERTWHVPDGNGLAWQGDPQDLAGLSHAFDRSEEAATYAASLGTTEGSVGDAMALKVQHDYLALQERAYRARHMSPIRGVMHAAARRVGHATDSYGAFDRVTQFAADLLVAGAAGWNPPQDPVA